MWAGMPRRIHAVGSSYYHVLNRSVRRWALFDKPGDYAAFVASLSYAQAKCPIPLLAFCIMPNHFHFVVGPVQMHDLSGFMHRLTVVHSTRWHAHRGTRGTGAVYQGRFKAFAIESELRLVVACRYVERNPLRAQLVRRAEQWPWSSLGQDGRNCTTISLAAWPIPKPPHWVDLVNGDDQRVWLAPGAQRTQRDRVS
jgi:putative transposase